ncbi:MAG: hypothetical protein JXQ27_16140 [Acidobacteria bacterium]|nr:hypothetical protein [Acidobacteriota bacterium]
MKPTPFDPARDLAPLPFTDDVCRLAADLKAAGLPWEPHVGCFVWDRAAAIEVVSPFPNRVYFILNLGHFLKRFGSVEKMREQLVWLPTDHQARLLCRRLGVEHTTIRAALSAEELNEPAAFLTALYRLILSRLQ